MVLIKINLHICRGVRSSTQAVLMLADTVKSNMIQNKTTGVLFFDYTDAFGSVNWNKSLHKLCNDFEVSID